MNLGRTGSLIKFSWGATKFLGGNTKHFKQFEFEFAV